MKYLVVTFYLFTELKEYDALKAPLLEQMHHFKVKGTIILASEGINGTFCGEEIAVEALLSYLLEQPALSQLMHQRSYSDFNPFDKAKVKLRPEIVTLGIDGIDPNARTGEHVSPEKWNQLLNDPDVLVIDTRNDYEVKLGSFKGAINPITDNFRDFPQYVEKHLKNKTQKIAMCCTGGVRCEKSTAYLKQMGFEEVYQLKGGILNYLAAIPKKASLWEGDCFVFDNRVALDQNLAPLEAGAIDPEWKNNHKKRHEEDI